MMLLTIIGSIVIFTGIFFYIFNLFDKTQTQVISKASMVGRILLWVFLCFILLSFYEQWIEKYYINPQIKNMISEVNGDLLKTYTYRIEIVNNVNKKWCFSKNYNVCWDVAMDLERIIEGSRYRVCYNNYFEYNPNLCELTREQQNRESDSYTRDKLHNLDKN